jgi:hypothetical protein
MISRKGISMMMEAAVPKDNFDDLSDLPPIPNFVYSKDGQKIDTSSSTWIAYASLDGGKRLTINWSLLERPASCNSMSRCESTLGDMASQRS